MRRELATFTIKNRPQLATSRLDETEMMVLTRYSASNERKWHLITIPDVADIVEIVLVYDYDCREVRVRGVAVKMAKRALRNRMPDIIDVAG